MSIRKYDRKDIDDLVSIWLEASILAHDFVPREFWESQVEAMRDVYIPASRTWVYDDADSVLGLASVCDKTLAALFVHPNRQLQGIGRAFISHVKERYDALELTVYAENQAAIKFYENHGFERVKKQICPHTGCDELLMKWEKVDR